MHTDCTAGHTQITTGRTLALPLSLFTALTLTLTPYSPLSPKAAKAALVVRNTRRHLTIADCQRILTQSILILHLHITITAAANDRMPFSNLVDARRDLLASDHAVRRVLLLVGVRLRRLEELTGGMLLGRKQLEVIVLRGGEARASVVRAARERKEKHAREVRGDMGRTLWSPNVASAVHTMLGGFAASACTSPDGVLTPCIKRQPL